MIILRNSTFILISGKMGIGKTTVANYMKEAAELAGINKPTILSIAKDVKVTARFMGWDGVKDAKGRKLLQHIGAAGRDYDQDIWISRAANRVEEYSPLYIVDDWRFQNELDYLVNNHFTVYTVRVETRRNDWPLRPQWELKSLEDASEVSLPSYIITDGTHTYQGNGSVYNYLINNSGTLENLKEISTEVVNQILQKEIYK